VTLVQKLLSTRGGTIAVSGIAAALAAAILILYLHRYRDSVAASTEPVRVLVANSLIEKGTPGNVVGSGGMFAATSMPRDEVKEGAITDPDSLRGQVAADDIYPGQPLTVADFKPGTGALASTIAAEQRAMSIPIDAAHGMIGDVQVGDRVDIFVGFNVKRLRPDGTPDPDAVERPVLKLLMEDVSVVGVPAETKAGFGAAQNQTSNVTLRVSDEQAAKLAFSSDNGKLWIVLRPRTGAEATHPDLVTLETVLFGMKPVTAVRSFGGAR
jgi:Flp pilus assembly protein CpaB